MKRNRMKGKYPRRYWSFGICSKTSRRTFWDTFSSTVFNLQKVDLLGEADRIVKGEE